MNCVSVVTGDLRARGDAMFDGAVEYEDATLRCVDGGGNALFDSGLWTLDSDAAH
jgi:hypothetical protein